MFRMKRMTALLMSVLIMGSIVCVPVMAAEATGEEPAAVREDAAGWQKINGAWYYFNADGAMLTGRQYVNGKWYNFSSSEVRL